MEGGQRDRWGEKKEDKKTRRKERVWDERRRREGEGDEGGGEEGKGRRRRRRREGEGERGG